MKISRPSSPSSPASSSPTAQGRSGTQAHAEPSGSQRSADGGPLASLANLSLTRRSALKRPAGDDGAGASSEPASKRRRLSVSFNVPVSDGAGKHRPAVRRVPADHGRAAVNRPADVNWPIDVNQRIAANQRAFLRRTLASKQPIVRLLHGEIGAEIARHLPPEDQRRLEATVPRPGDRRADHARLLPPQLGGVYLNADEEALAYAQSETDAHGVPFSADVLLDRAGWLLLAGTRAAATPGLAMTGRMRDAMGEAESRLLRTFDRAGPTAQAEAMRNLISTCACAETVDDAWHFARTALAPQRFHGLPPAEQAGALAVLAGHCDNVEAREWGRAQALPDAEMRLERQDELTDQHCDGMSSTMPLLLDAARRIGPMPSGDACLLARSVINLIDRQLPDIATQQAALDLLEIQLPHLQGDDRSAALAHLATIFARFEQPQDQRRALNMLLRRPPGTPPSDDRLSHLNAAAQVTVTHAVCRQLIDVEDDGVCNEALGLLDNQLEPGRLARFPNEVLQSSLSNAAMLDVPADSRQRLFSLVERTLDALPGERIVQPLRQLLLRATQPPPPDLPEPEQQVWAGLNQQMLQAWLRSLPRVPAVQRADLLASAVAVDPEVLPVALSRLAGVAPETHRAMLAGIGEPQREAFANVIVHAWMLAPGSTHEAMHRILSAQPPAQQATAAASLAATFAWAASAAAGMPHAVVSSAMEAAVTRVFSAIPAGQLVPALAACIRRDEFPLLSAAASLHLRNLGLADEGRVLAALTHALSGDAPHTRALAFAFVTARLAACVPGREDGFAGLARQLSPDAAHTWAQQLQAELDEALRLQLASGPRPERLHTRVERIDAEMRRLPDLRLAIDPHPGQAPVDTSSQYATARAMIEALHAYVAGGHV